MPPADRTAWERLGRLLAERRSQISPRYANRRAFAADREMNWRTLHDIEQAKRTNFKPGTFSAFEGAYMLVPGSLERTLAGGGLEPLPPAPEARPLQALPGAGAPPSPSERALADLVAAYPDDDVIAAMAAQRRKDPAVIVAEIYRWLDFLAAQGGRGENGASAGLPEGKPSGNVKIAPRLRPVMAVHPLSGVNTYCAPPATPRPSPPNGTRPGGARRGGKNASAPLVARGGGSCLS